MFDYVCYLIYCSVFFTEERGSLQFGLKINSHPSVTTLWCIIHNGVAQEKLKTQMAVELQLGGVRYKRECIAKLLKAATALITINLLLLYIGREIIIF